jgi:hypothetical protein
MQPSPTDPQHKQALLNFYAAVQPANATPAKVEELWMKHGGKGIWHKLYAKYQDAVKPYMQGLDIPPAPPAQAPAGQPQQQGSLFGAATGSGFAGFAQAAQGQASGFGALAGQQQQQQQQSGFGTFASPGLAQQSTFGGFGAQQQQQQPAQGMTFGSGTAAPTFNFAGTFGQGQAAPSFGAPSSGFNMAAGLRR